MHKQNFGPAQPAEQIFVFKPYVRVDLKFVVVVS